MHPVNDSGSEETLLLYHYGELPASQMQATRERMESDPELASRYAELVAFLESLDDPHAPVMPDEFHGRRLAARVLERIPDDTTATRSRASWNWLAGGLAASLVLGMVFVLGRVSVDTTSTTYQASVPDDSGELADARQLQAKLLKASLAQHLESSSRFLRQVDNANPSTVDMEAEKDWAATLLVANRLYRFAAEQAGQRRIASVLEDMEPILLEMANEEGNLTDEEFARLRNRIESRDLLFKVDVTSRSIAANQPRNDSI